MELNEPLSTNLLRSRSGWRSRSPPPSTASSRPPSLFDGTDHHSPSSEGTCSSSERTSSDEEEQPLPPPPPVALIRLPTIHAALRAIQVSVLITMITISTILVASDRDFHVLATTPHCTTYNQSYDPVWQFNVGFFGIAFVWTAFSVCREAGWRTSGHLYRRLVNYGLAVVFMLQWVVVWAAFMCEEE